MAMCFIRVLLRLLGWDFTLVYFERCCSVHETSGVRSPFFLHGIYECLGCLLLHFFLLGNEVGDCVGFCRIGLFYLSFKL